MYKVVYIVLSKNESPSRKKEQCSGGEIVLKLDDLFFVSICCFVRCFSDTFKFSYILLEINDFGFYLDIKSGLFGKLYFYIKL